MLSLLPNCKQSVWASGDIGRYDSNQYDSNLGIGEVGLGTRFCNGIQLNLAVGRIYSKAETGFNGKTLLQSTYLRPEVIYQWGSSSLHTTLTGLYSFGDADIDRGYINAGNMVQSQGNTSTHTAGARIRFDWQNALKIDSTNLTPYFSLSYLKTRLSNYTETGGGFPAAWSRRNEDATTLHAGVDVVHPLNAKTNLLGRVEAAHRFESQGSDAHGELLGLNAFTINGQSIKQSWLRVGGGVQSNIFDGVASLMLNVTTRGETPTYWLNATYRLTF